MSTTLTHFCTMRPHHRCGGIACLQQWLVLVVVLLIPLIHGGHCQQDTSVTLFVGPGGSTSAPCGSSKQPCGSLKLALAQTSSSDDVTVVVLPADYRIAQCINVPERSGTLSIMSHAAFISSTSTSTSTGTSGNQAAVTFQCTTTASASCFLSVAGAPSLLLKGLAVRNCQRSALVVQGTPRLTVEDCTFANNTHKVDEVVGQAAQAGAEDLWQAEATLDVAGFDLGADAAGPWYLHAASSIDGGMLSTNSLLAPGGVGGGAGMGEREAARAVAGAAAAAASMPPPPLAATAQDRAVGGAIIVMDALRVTVSQSTFANNVAHSGGAIYISLVPGAGGGQHATTAEVSIVDSTFRDNAAVSPVTGLALGGAFAVSAANSTLTTIAVQGTTFESNTVGGRLCGQGGAVSVAVNTSAGLTVDISDSTFHLNQATAQEAGCLRSMGGAVSLVVSESTNTNSRFTNNVFHGNLVSGPTTYVIGGAVSVLVSGDGAVGEFQGNRFQNNVVAGQPTTVQTRTPMYAVAGALSYK